MILSAASGDTCNVYYFMCPKCERMASVPDTYRQAIMCTYCNEEMKEVVTLD